MNEFASSDVLTEVKRQKKRELAMGGVILISCFLALYNAIAINVALPQFMVHFKAGVGTVQWIEIGYTLVMGVVSPLAAYFARRLTLRRYYLIGITAFFMFSLCSGFANNIYTIIVVRSVQGFAGVALIPATMMIIYQYIPRQRRPLYLTLQSMSLSLGPAVGPMLAGAFITLISWRWIFWFNVPLGLIALLCAWYGLPREEGQAADGPVDWRSFVFVVSGCFSILLSLSFVQSWGFYSPGFWLMILGGAALVTIFVRRQKYLPHPVLDFSVVKNREYAFTLVINALLSMALCIGPFILAIFFQNIQGYSAMTYGLLLLIPAVFSMSGAPLAQRLYQRWPSKWLIAIGLFLMGAGSVALGFLSVESALLYSIGFLCFRYLGIGLLGMPLTDHGMRELPQAQTNDGAALINWLKLMTTSLSLSVFTLLYEVVEAAYHAQGPALAALKGVNAVFLSSGVACIIGLILALRLKAVAPRSRGK